MAHIVQKWTFYVPSSLSVPPKPSLLPPELYCDVPLEDGRPVIIKWMVSDVYRYICTCNNSLIDKHNKHNTNVLITEG